MAVVAIETISFIFNGGDGNILSQKGAFKINIYILLYVLILIMILYLPGSHVDNAVKRMGSHFRVQSKGHHFLAGMSALM